MFADVHCHLYFFPYYREIIERAIENNVKLMFSNCTSLESLQENKRIALEFPENVKALYALHPCDLLEMKAADITLGMKWIEENLHGRECVGIGETGLDFKYAKTDAQKQLQEKYFAKHIELAVENALPLEVHSRRAQKQCLEILEAKRAESVVMHWFYGKEKLLKRVIENNFFISVGPGMVNRKETQNFVKKIPLELLLLETDASPIMFGKKHSEPAWIIEIAKKVAELKEMQLKELEKQLERNLKQLFKI